MANSKKGLKPGAFFVFGRFRNWEFRLLN